LGACLDLGAPLVDFPLGVFEDALFFELGLVLLIERVLAFFQPAFLLAQIVAVLFDVPVKFLAFLEEFVLGFELGLLAKIFSFLFGSGENVSGVGLALGESKAILKASAGETNQQTHQSGQADDYRRAGRLPRARPSR